MVLFLQKKIRYRLLGLITDFFLVGDFMPLSTLSPAEDNNTLDENDNKTNKVSNGR
jgi:hypothetical protein